MNKVWFGLSRLCGKAHFLTEVLNYWAWGNYWYGPKGAGQINHPHLKKVEPPTLAQAWREPRH